MPDYHAFLARRISEAETDPSKIRQVVYEAARLALKRQMHLSQPPFGLAETQRQLCELEDAIARLEAEAGPRQGLEEDPEPDLHGASQPSAPIRQDDHGAARSREADAAGPFLPGDPESAEAAAEGLHISEDRAAAKPGRKRNRFSERPDELQSDLRGMRELVLVPDLDVPTLRRSNYMVDPADFVASAVTYRPPPEPRRMVPPLLRSGLSVAFQCAVAGVAAAALYLALGQRLAVAPPQPPAVAPATSAGASGGSLAIAAGAQGAARGPGDAGQAGVVMPVTAPPLPLPSSYGIYALGDDRLIELEQMPTQPADPRTRNLLEIIKPGHTVIANAKLRFIAFRRDLVSSAPEKVTVRIAARVARAMNFDAAGKAVVAALPTATWLIRDQGYDLRVSPVRESQEMVLMRPEDSEFSFPAGRYELMLGGQAYDFVVAGPITDPAQCVEGVATTRGPAFYECRQP
jgi:hypothetical protein